jgi:hypothetical protein
MPTLSITKSYADGNTLFESDLDNIKDGLETFINVTRLDADNLQDSAVTTAKLANGAVTAPKLASGAVTAPKIADGAVETAKIADGAVTAAKLAADAVVEAKIEDGAVTTAKIADNAVTQAKLAARPMTSNNVPTGDVAVSSSSGTFNTTSTSFTNVSNLSVTIITTGGPIQLELQSASTSESYVRLNDSASPFGQGQLQFTRDNASLGVLEIPFYGSAADAIPPAAFAHVDAPAAGTYIYRVQVLRTSAANSVDVRNCRLVAYEI